MLEPNQRALLLDALRPPAGMVLDHAVATTFTLDLDALLIAPVAFALFDVEDGRVGSVDPISLLEAVRRNADRIDVFCQAGQIGVPPAYQPTLSQLEESVHPVAPSIQGGIFHPKLWALRFMSTEGSDSHHRVLVLSRNLTFDRSWDLVVRLEEGPKSEGRLPALARLLRRLPEMSINPIDARRTERIEAMAATLERTGFSTPPPFRSLGALSVLGIGKATAPEAIVDDAQRLLVMAPFIGEAVLKRLTKGGQETTLISRTESLDQVGQDTLDRFAEVLVLDPLALPDGDQPTGNTGVNLGSLTGLHAKLIIAERGGHARWWIGSANATSAAFEANVEAMLALEGPKREVGVDSFLGLGAKDGLHTLLREYVRSSEAETPEETTDSLALESEGRRIAGIPFRAVITTLPESDGYSLRLTSAETVAPRGGSAPRFWPIALPRERAIAVTLGKPAVLDFGQVSLQAITPFFAFEIQRQGANGPLVRTFVVRAALDGDPENRRERILTAQLGSKRDVLRYLLLLLSDLTNESAFSAGSGAPLGASSGAHASGGPTLPLFEAMIRTLASNPRSLDYVARLIDDLRSTEEGLALLPDGLERVWDPIWQARQALR